MSNHYSAERLRGMPAIDLRADVLHLAATQQYTLCCVLSRFSLRLESKSKSHMGPHKESDAVEEIDAQLPHHDRIREKRDVRAVVRPLAEHDAAYVDVRIGAGVTFDVILHSDDGGASFVHIQRCLHDFMQLEHDLHHECSGNKSDLETLPRVVETIRTYMVMKKQQEQQCRDANTSLLYPAHLVEPRFAWQLETYLSSLITHGSANVRDSQALQRFLHGDIADRVTLCSDVGKERHRERYACLVETLLAKDYEREHDVGDERIASGCSVEHTAPIQYVDEDDEVSMYLVLWKFASRGDRVVFAARFAQEHEPLRSAGEVCAAADPYSAVDPYQSTADAWGESISSPRDGNEDDDDAVLSVQDGPLSQFMVQYRTQYAFSAKDTTPQEFVYGHFVATSPGTLSLEWSNEDSSSILSKPLAFHVHIVPLAQAGDAGEELVEVFDRKRGGQEDGDDDESWLQRLLKGSTIKSLEDVVLGSSDDEQASMAVVEDGMRRHQTSFTNELETQMQRLREEKHFHEQRAAELEERVSHLEEALRETKKELKKAQDDIEISGEIYKASLETIAQLEMHKPAASSSTQEEKVDSVTTEADGCPRGLNGAFDAKEYQRVVDLCTTFQEQCLWRSIEVAESEKRNLSLDAKLTQVTRENAELVAQLEARNALVIDLRTQNQTLKAHKTLLVQEVKKLRPFSQINVAALVQDAQEARMMQRSLQAQLNAVSMRANQASPSPAPAALEDEEESEPGFVVIESRDRSNDDDEDDGTATKKA
ncbi:hypothetical protein FI667_g6851, partial [Globisporangium splendens]